MANQFRRWAKVEWTVPRWPLPIVIWDRPEGRDMPLGHEGGGGGSSSSDRPPSHRPEGRSSPPEGWVKESDWHPDPAKQQQPTGAGVAWRKWREDNPGAARRSVAGLEGREKTKEAIFQDRDGSQQSAGDFGSM